MRILVVSKYFPDNLSTKVHGVHKRFRMFLEAIKDIAEIDLLYYVPHGTDTSPNSTMSFERFFSAHFKTPIHLSLSKRSYNENLLSKLIGYLIGTFSFVRQPSYSNMAGSPQVRSFETCLRNNPDAIFVHRLSAMSPILLTRKSLPPVFLDLDDIDHIAFKRGISYIRNAHTRLFSYFLIPALFWGEYRSVRLSKRTFVCSEVDRRTLADRCRLKGVVTIPNAVDIPKPQPKTLEETLLFIGSYLHKPNIDAAEFLIRQIWPNVHKAIPTATLIIAGAPPDKIPSYRDEHPGLKFTGFVEDLDSLYRQTRVVCAPILSGSGTRVKILEAAAYGKPIVSTRIGAEGIQMQDGHDILLNDDPKKFAEACVRLLKDDKFYDRMGSAARATVTEKYDQAKIRPLIQKYFKNKIIKELN